MEILACGHLFVITKENEIFCKCCLVDNIDDDLEFFNIHDIFNSNESIEDYIVQYTQSYESLDDMTSEADSIQMEDILYTIPKSVAKDCPYCNMTFNKKYLERDILADYNVEDDVDGSYFGMVQWFLSNSPTQWNKKRKWYAPPPTKLSKIKKISSMKKICSWESITSN